VFAKTVINVAGEVGLPVFMVDIRHDATHNELPPLSILRTSILKALQWLYDTYWRVQQEAGDGVSAKVPALLKQYITARLAEREGREPKDDEIAELSVPQILAQIKASVGLRFLKGTLVATLLETGFLVPDKKRSPPSTSSSSSSLAISLA